MRAQAALFHDYSGLVQLQIDKPADLEVIHALEPARWSSSSAPVEQFICDPAVLRMMDTDGNHRIRVSELRAAHRWFQARTRNINRLIERTDTVFLSDLEIDHDGALALRSLCARMLGELGRETTGEATLSLAEIRSFRDSFASSFPNGDGTVIPAQLEDDDLKALAAEIVAVTGGSLDLSDEAGVDAADLDDYLARARAYILWEAQAQPTASGALSRVFPLGESTAVATALIESLAAKLDQLFAQCDLLAQDPHSASRLISTPEQLAALDISNPARIRDWLSAASLAPPNPEGRLYFDGSLNPLYRDELLRLEAEVLPLLRAGADTSRDANSSRSMGRVEWETLREAVAPYIDWRERRPRGLPADTTGERLSALLAGTAHSRLRALIDQDNEASEDLRQIGDLERFALYQRWLMQLANNMVSFPSLFHMGERALFVAGTLVLDGRELYFCVRVFDKAAHRPIAEQSELFILYVELERKEGINTSQMLICAAITAGVRGSVYVGKRGVFYDREDQEWDARVVDLIERPISLWEAAIAPVIRIQRFVSARFQVLIGDKVAGAETGAQAGAQPGSATPPKPPDRPSDKPNNTATWLIGGSVAFAALGSSMAFIIGTIKGLFSWEGLAAITLVITLIMGLSALLGWFRLRRRDLSTVLEAGGWAFNLRLKLRRGHSLYFTRVPRLPQGSRRERHAIEVPSFEEDAGGRAFARLLIIIFLGLAALLYVFRQPLIDAYNAQPVPAVVPAVVPVAPAAPTGS